MTGAPIPGVVDGRNVGADPDGMGAGEGGSSIMVCVGATGTAVGAAIDPLAADGSCVELGAEPVKWVITVGPDEEAALQPAFRVNASIMKDVETNLR